MIIGLIASAFISCSENKADKIKEKPEVILEQKISSEETLSEAQELQHAISNLQSLNEEQIRYLNSQNNDEQVIIEEEKGLKEQTIKQSLDELNRLNNEQKKLQKNL